MVIILGSESTYSLNYLVDLYWDFYVLPGIFLSSRSAAVSTQALLPSQSSHSTVNRQTSSVRYQGLHKEFHVRCALVPGRSRKTPSWRRLQRKPEVRRGSLGDNQWKERSTRSRPTRPLGGKGVGVPGTEAVVARAELRGKGAGPQELCDTERRPCDSGTRNHPEASEAGQ